MQQICFTMSVAIEHLESYERMHAQVWPVLLRELERTGWTNYSLFLRDDGLLVGYLETPDWDAAQQAMASTEVAGRWSREMDRLVVPGSSMRYPTLARHDASPGAAHRRCFVVDGAISPAQVRTAGLGNVSVFERGDRLTVLYGETADLSSRPAPDLGDPLREVFNLAGALASGDHVPSP
jgi:L-rhamnose mutarotase